MITRKQLSAIILAAPALQAQWLNYPTAGVPRSTYVRRQVTERFRRPSFGKLEIDITIDDPKAYTKPWSIQVHQALALDTDLIEFVCLENEKDIPHLVGK